MLDLPPLALIAGPTASGKSALAMALAERIDGVVVNADSAQVYRDLRIITARPSLEDQARVPHRLFGHVDGAVAHSAAAWADEAWAAIAAAHAAGKLPIVVGGTGLYLRTLIDGIAPVPSIPDDLRANIRALGAAEAYGKLGLADPAGAARLHPHDASRIARALEVVHATGRPLSEWQSAREGGIGDRVTLAATVLLPDRGVLGERIDARLTAMFDAGAIDEVAALLARSEVPADAPVRRAIGVPEIARLLAGDLDRGTALDAARLATRQYAKRQYTWFRNQPPPSWTREDVTEECYIIDKLVTKLRKSWLT